MDDFTYPLFDVDAYTPMCSLDWANETRAMGRNLLIETHVNALVNSWLTASSIASIPTSLIGDLESARPLWDTIQNNVEARKVIYDAQQGAFILFVDAYNKFMMACAHTVSALNMKSAATKHGSAATFFEATFGKPMLVKCYHNDNVDFFLKVRDSIVNHCGSIVPLMENENHDIVVHDRTLRIRHNENMLAMSFLSSIVREFIQAQSSISENGG